MKEPIVQIVARNAKAAYESSRFKSYRELAKKAGTSANTVKNVMEPDTRPPNSSKDASPKLDSVEKIANALGFEGWQFMQANFDAGNPPELVLSHNEAEFHKKIEEAYKMLDRSRFDGNDKSSGAAA